MPLRMSLTISGHAHSKTLLKAAVLAPVPVHAHDEAVFILHAHFIVDVLLDAASEETLETRCKESKNKSLEIHSSLHTNA